MVDQLLPVARETIEQIIQAATKNIEGLRSLRPKNIIEGTIPLIIQVPARDPISNKIINAPIAEDMLSTAPLAFLYILFYTTNPIKLHKQQI